MFGASAFQEKLAATYSRGAYRTTTIGKTVFDGRVRNGNGSGHSFKATKNLLKSLDGCSLKTAHRRKLGNYVRELNRYHPPREGGKKRSSRTTD